MFLKVTKILNLQLRLLLRQIPSPNVCAIRTYWIRFWTKKIVRNQQDKEKPAQLFHLNEHFSNNCHPQKILFFSRRFQSIAESQPHNSACKSNFIWTPGWRLTANQQKWAAKNKFNQAIQSSHRKKIEFFQTLMREDAQEQNNSTSRTRINEIWPHLDGCSSKYQPELQRSTNGTNSCLTWLLIK